MPVDEGAPAGYTPPGLQEFVGDDAPQIKAGDWFVHKGAVWEWDAGNGRWKFVDSVRSMRAKTGIRQGVFKPGRVGPKDRTRLNVALQDDTVGGGTGPGSSNDRLPTGPKPGGSTPEPQPTSTGGGGGGGGGNAADEDDDELTRKYEVWKVGGDHYVVFTVPGTDVPMAWRIGDDEELDRWTLSGDVPATDVTRAQMRDKGTIRFGNSRELPNPDELEHPWAIFNQRYKDAVAVKPWLRDPEMLALHAASWLETGSDPSIEQIQQTEWWQTHTPSERAAMERWAGEGKDAFKEQFGIIRSQVEQDLTAAGFDFAGGNRDRVLNHLAREVIWGRLTEDEYTDTVEQMANPYAAGALPTAGYDRLPRGAQAVRFDGRTYIRHNGKDYALAHGLETALYGKGAKKVNRVNDVGALHDNMGRVFGGGPTGRDAQGGIEQVRDTVLQWGGPLVAKGFSETELAQWAARIEQNPDSEQELVAELRQSRLSLYPQYDANLTYEAIARPWRGLMQDSWGQVPAEDDAMLQQLIQLNDAGRAQMLLRGEGRKRGVTKVVHESLADLSGALGGGIVRSPV